MQTVPISTHTATKPFKKNPKQVLAVRMISEVTHLYNMLYGGSRSGKTFILVRSIVIRALRYPRSRHLILRLHFAHVKQSVWHETLPKVMELCFPGVTYTENRQDWFITFPNGSEIWIGGLDDKERAEKVLGKEYATIYFNECSQLSWRSVRLAITRLAQVVDGCRKKLYFDCNPPNKRHWTYIVWKKLEDPETGRKWEKPEIFASMQMNPRDNLENLGQEYMDILDTLSDRDKQRFREGEFLDDAEGALVKYGDIIRQRIDPDKFNYGLLDTINIGVDPAVTFTTNSDEIGIVAVGYNKASGRLYVLGDYSLKDTPLRWARAVVKAYDTHEANKVIGEVNNGGDLVEVNLRTVSKCIPFQAVRASKNKQIRAEPVATMIEKGMLSMVGEFPMLEEELTSWVPDSGLKSPNRLDAMVWAAWPFLKGGKRGGLWGHAC